MIERVKKIVDTFRKFNIEYMFIGKFAAILYGYPGTTQDIDIFPKKDKTNCENLLKALKELGFAVDKNLEEAILEGKDFIQIRGGPFPLDIIFAPDGIESYDAAQGRSKLIEGMFQMDEIDQRDEINQTKAKEIG